MSATDPKAVPVDDPALPGLPVATSPRRLGEALSDRFGTPVSVRPRRLRHKPGTSFVLAFDAVPDAPAEVRSEGRDDQPLVAFCWSPAGAAKFAKTLERARREDVLHADRGSLLLVTSAAADRDLPLVGRLDDPAQRGAALQRLLPHVPDPGDATLVTLRYNPARRWVGRLQSPGAGTVVLRAHPKHETRGLGRRYEQLWNGDRLTPPLLGMARSLGGVAVGWGDGDPLTVDSPRSAWLAAGAALARLHAREGTRLPKPGVRADVDTVTTSVGMLGTLVPAESALLAETGHALHAALLAHPGGPAVPLHGDFSPDQVVVDTSGHVTLIDLDRAQRGPAARDLGSAVATVMTATEEAGDPARGRHLCALLVEGYATVQRPPAAAQIAAYALAFRLRRAHEPFRDGDPAWRTRVTARVRAAHDALGSLRGGGWG